MDMIFFSKYPKVSYVGLSMLVLVTLQIKESHRQEEKAFTDFMEFVTRTSDYDALKVGVLTNKQWLSRAIRVQTRQWGWLRTVNCLVLEQFLLVPYVVRTYNGCLSE